MAKKEKSYGEILTAGFIKENPVLRLVLGTCGTDRFQCCYFVTS